jgi:hypothetical protein
MLGYASIGDAVSNFFNVWKALSQSFLQTYLLPFFKSSIGVFYTGK